MARLRANGDLIMILGKSIPPAPGRTGADLHVRKAFHANGHILVKTIGGRGWKQWAICPRWGIGSVIDWHIDTLGYQEVPS